MDSATLVLSALAIIIILQIVLIVLIVRGRKTAEKPAPVAVPPASNDSRDPGKRRDDNRFNKRPMMDQRPKPFVRSEPQPVDRMETSLRDINLRLKNAERDQENARKNIRDVIAPPQNSQRRPDQNNGRPNRGRDDDFRRRDRNNRPQGGQFRDRNRGPEADRSRGPEADRPQQPIAFASQPAIANTPSAAAPPPVMPPLREPAQNPQPSIAVSQPVMAKEPLAVVPENTEVLHGRKVLVRRRIISPEEQVAAGTPQAANPAAPSQPQPAVGEVKVPVPQAAQIDAIAPPQAGNAGESEAQEIHFGR
jgi:hypothetical protein